MIIIRLLQNLKNQGISGSSEILQNFYYIKSVGFGGMLYQ